MALWSTPDTPTSITWSCRSFTIPFVLLDKVLGALGALLYEDNWEKDGTMTVEEAVEYMDDMWSNMRRCGVIGEVIPHVLAVLPENWLLCDGAQYFRVDYPVLYSVIHPNLIIDADNFVVPDLQDKTAGGVGPLTVVGQSGGTRRETLSQAEMPIHRHQLWQFQNIALLEGLGVPYPFAVTAPQIPANTSQVGGGQSHNNLPPYYILEYAIVAE